MDCYSEYKHHNHHHYQPPTSLYHPYYANEQLRQASSYNDSHHQYYADGYSRHHQHYMHPHGVSAGSYSYETNNEHNSQFYNYSNAHQASYYDAYRNPSVPPSNAYRYHHFQQHPQPSAYNYHQPMPQNFYHPPDHFNRYSTPPQQSASQVYHQQQHSPMRPNSSFPQYDSERHDNKLLNNDNMESKQSSSPSSNPVIHNNSSIAKINDSVDKNEAPIVEEEQSDEVQQVKSETISKASTPQSEGGGDCGSDNENRVNSESETQNSKDSELVNSNKNSCNDDSCEDRKSSGEIEVENHENNRQSENGSYKEKNHLQNEASSLPRTSFRQESATDYQQHATREPQNDKKFPEESDKNAKLPMINRSRMSEQHSNLISSHNRCSTPSIGYNDHHNFPYNHQRYPYWHSPEYYHNWMNSSFHQNRRMEPSQFPMFSSSPPSAVHRAKKSPQAERSKNDNSSPPVKRKRKPRVEENVNLENKLKEVIKDPLKNVTPLPGFLQTFGQTEIGKFSEAFCTSSESPIPYYNNSVESDVDSPLQPWDFDSLDGPVGGPMQVGNFYSESEFDSPINSFSEIMCREF